MLNMVTAISHEFGTAEYVRGGGGNTSAKDRSTLWVKPSGTTLSGLKPGLFVAMDRERLGRLYSVQIPPDAREREELVKQMMANAVKPGQDARPSVEAPLHDILEGTYVVHTHPALVNGMTCSVYGREACQRLFPDALWVPYVDPGFVLCMDVRRRVDEYKSMHGRAPSLLFLENHGVFVTGNTDEEIRESYRRVIETLRRAYREAGVPQELPVGRGEGEASAVMLQRVIGDEAVAIVYGGRFDTVRGPISPDHIVYAKSFFHEGEVTRSGLDAFRKQRGYTPLVYVTPQGVYAIGSTQKKASLALEFALDGGLVKQLAGAFGGIRYLDDRSREFIEHWEVESYRQRQA